MLQLLLHLSSKTPLFSKCYDFSRCCLYISDNIKGSDNSLPLDITRYQVTKNAETWES